ncbi:protein of unknown function [Bradyrhizobium vignae]|uniref:Uncharacterized protein n=1 Tax=Bradyrhizobium vignae TaxID=1549949 RepID=A0A2U3QBM7_9BRAD|nr:protein of unknown function [Bradyrhizobium vignae]
MESIYPRARYTSPEGRGRFAKANRVRGYGLSLERRPLTRIASQSDLSPLGRGVVADAVLAQSQLAAL